MPRGPHPTRRLGTLFLRGSQRLGPFLSRRNDSRLQRRRLGEKCRRLDLDDLFLFDNLFDRNLDADLLLDDLLDGDFLDHFLFDDLFDRYFLDNLFHNLNRHLDDLLDNLHPGLLRRLRLIRRR